MKKIIISFFFVLIALILVEQSQINAKPLAHLAFKGVPIDGTLSEYVLKMQKNGFVYMGTKDGVAMLKGDFASYKDCIVGLVTLKQRDLVSKVAVIFPQQDAWSLLSSNYFSLKEMLNEKYGKPSICVEEFSGLTPSDENMKMYEVRFDNCKYRTTYETDRGSIELSIEHVGVSSCFVLLTYYDKINSDIVKAKAMGDL